MYYVNRQQIDNLTAYLPRLAGMTEQLLRDWQEDNAIHQAALERIIHLALEAVTDIGSLLIDGYVLRDASSYEDIIGILEDEQVIGQEQKEFFLVLVRQRRALVQEYGSIDHGFLLQLAKRLGSELAGFIQGVHGFMEKEQL